MLAGCSSNRLHEAHQINKLERITFENTKYDMYETLLRHFFENNGCGLPGPRPLPAYWNIYIAINDTQFENEDELMMRFPCGFDAIKSPNDVFMKRFANDGRKIFAAPEGDSARTLANKHNVFRKGEEMPKERVIIFMIDGCVQNENGTVTVMAAYYVHNLNAGTYRYSMKFENGKWIVLDAKCTGMS